ncbi:FtsK/SpoIIIE family DNA translocase [Salimicrobium halophilum]|uniref:DNA translocase FtsK n=1 Tax=Salimicrobium halophilum TaxID=86666 RepID=A0A1G8Q807_9BACI|nr:DNA translocase FtsK [Salimicrobium halophilum]SDJ00821.1 DNA translocase FtsK [Salimicrobium halophilum]
MANRKRNKKKKSKINDQIRFELIGLLFIALSIFGSGIPLLNAGAIPGFLTYFFRLILGLWYIVIPVGLLIIGVYLMIRRKWPLIQKKRGIVMVALGVLLVSHAQALSQSAGGVFSSTWELYRTGEPFFELGGGFTGAILYSLTYFLFGQVGSIIVAVFLVVIGSMMIREWSPAEKLTALWERRKKLLKKRKRKKPQPDKQQDQSEDNEVTVEEEMDHRVDQPIIQDFTEQAKVGKAKESTPTEEKESPPQQEEKEVSLATAEMENHDYELPGYELLKAPEGTPQSQDRSHIQRTVKKLEATFESFGVKAKVTKVHVGPSVTKYEINPDTGVKVSKIVNLHDDLALSLAARDIRIEAPIPGKSAVGIEVPNQEISMVTLREVLETTSLSKEQKLGFALGRDISGEAVMAELNKMPHLLVAGATGSGKSVCINGIITSILMRAKPHEVKMMMIDPKKVELNVYNGIPHLLSPVVTDPKKASRALKKVVSEMERRYDLFSESGTRNIEGYNHYIKRHNEYEGDDQPTLPYVVVLVDELADLMMVASNEVEESITRLAQMARAAGIHLIIATQRPSVDVITGVIKANIPSRIAFSVSSQTDSRTILDSGGAEKLLGRGDMLFTPVGANKPTRVQGAFLSDEEVEKVVNFCVEQQKAQYQEEMIPEEESEVQQEVDDDLYPEAVQMVVEMQSASASMIQRRFRVGYTRAARLVDAMEENGIVGPSEGSKPRAVLVSQVEEKEEVPEN